MYDLPQALPEPHDHHYSKFAPMMGFSILVSAIHMTLLMQLINICKVVEEKNNVKNMRC